jgi:FSR family fosmidomycin resistance protein-like MFS transporter
VLLAIELLDELVGGTRAAAWPGIRTELHLSYAQVGLVLAVPGFVGSTLDPLVGALGDTPRRRALVVAGGFAFALSAALTAGAVGFWTLLVALVIGYPASGAFVSLAQATLMDAAPEERERNMARWTLAGSFGYVGGPVLLTGALWAGLGWRAVIGALALLTLPLVAAAHRLPRSAVIDGGSPVENLRHALAALRRREVLRWLALLECVDLLMDVFHGFLALYLVDVAGARPAEAALGVGVWTAAGLAGDWLVLLVLRRVGGLRYLRVTAALALLVYPAFLVTPGIGAKLGLVAVLGLLNSGWYAIPQARLYAALPGRSGSAIAVGGVGGFAGASVPLVLGFVAGATGLAATMWILLLAPLALLVFAPRE